MNSSVQLSAKGYVPGFLSKDKQLLFNGTQLTKFASIACRELFLKEEDLIPKWNNIEKYLNLREIISQKKLQN